MRRKTRKKYRSSVQQTFCVNDSFKKFLKGTAKFLLGMFIREILSEVFHSESIASIWASIKELIQWRS